MLDLLRYARPIATCLSSEYQLPIPLLQPTLRLPMASMLFSVLGVGAFRPASLRRWIGPRVRVCDEEF